VSRPGPNVPVPHDTVGGYTNHRCRCELCTAAQREYQQRLRARYLERPREDLAHGTYNAYANYGCRCDACREAHNAYLPATQGAGACVVTAVLAHVLATT
jgi:hypothetical protein